MNKHQLSIRHLFQRIAYGVLLGFVPAMVGCGPSKESLFEVDHVVPAHWPKDLGDAATKISEKLAVVKSDPSHAISRKELRDLVEWVPEIAADTDISEQQWIPIHALSATLGRHLVANDIDVADFEEDFSRLTQLLLAANSPIANSNVASEVPGQSIQPSTENQPSSENQ